MSDPGVTVGGADILEVRHASHFFRSLSSPPLGEVPWGYVCADAFGAFLLKKMDTRVPRTCPQFPSMDAAP